MADLDERTNLVVGMAVLAGCTITEVADPAGTPRRYSYQLPNGAIGPFQHTIYNAAHFALMRLGIDHPHE